MQTSHRSWPVDPGSLKLRGTKHCSAVQYGRLEYVFIDIIFINMKETGGTSFLLTFVNDMESVTFPALLPALGPRRVTL